MIINCAPRDASAPLPEIIVVVASSLAAFWATFFTTVAVAFRMTAFPALVEMRLAVFLSLFHASDTHRAE